MHLTNGAIAAFFGFQYVAHVTNDEGRRRTNQPPVTSARPITAKRLNLFGHLARADPSQDHSRALRASINRPPDEWCPEPVDQGELGFAQSNWTSAGATSVAILRGNVRKTDINGSRGDSYSLGMSPDDHDNYERTEHGRELF